MNIDKLIKKIQERQGQIRNLRAKLNAEEVRLFKLRDKLSEKQTKQKA